MKGRVTSAVTQPGSSSQHRATVVNTQGDLRVTVGPLDDGVGPSHGTLSVSFRALAEDQMSTAGLEKWAIVFWG